MPGKPSVLPMYCKLVLATCVAILATCSPPCLWWQSVPTRKRLRASGWQRHLCRRKHFRCQKSRSNGDQRNPRHVSLNITKCDVDIRKDLSDNVVMHCHDPRDRRTRDEGVDCVGTTNDVLRCCLHQRIPWQSSLASPDGVTGGTSLAHRVSSFVQDALRGGLRAWPQLEWLGVPNRLPNPERFTVRRERVHFLRCDG